MSYSQSTTGFDNVPMPLTVTSHTSPTFSHPFGSIPAPTPAGVPVAIISPGRSVMHLLTVSMSVLMSKII